MSDESELDIDSIQDDQNPLYQNLQIYRARLTGILDKAIEKIEIAFCLEDLLKNNAYLIKSYLPKKDYDYILERTASTDLSVSRRPSLKSKSIKSKFKTFKSTVISETKQDSYYSNLMTKLHRVKEIRQLAKKIIQRKPMKVIEFYILMKDLRNYVHQKFNTTATEEVNYEKQLVVAYQNNQKYIKKNQELSEYYETKMQDLLQTLQGKHSLVIEQEDIKEKMKAKCLEEIHEIVNDSEYRMSKLSEESEEMMHFLTEEAKKITIQYQQLLESHLAQEKKLRVKRFKVETQLANWLAKYDSDIGELNAIYEGIKDEYDAEQSEINKLQALFDEQEEEYVVLMEEKRLEDERIWNARYYAFIKLRSARKIQRWWNEVWISKKKKKKKRGKGKKK